MIWLTWRQSRLESLIGGAVLAFVAVYLTWTGLDMISAYKDAGLPACVAAQAPDDTCRESISYFLAQFDSLRGIKMVLFLCLPFLVGLLLAAPTVLDFEQGTYRLAWTQGITRRRWLLMKIGVGLAVATMVSAVLIAIWTWWLGPLDDIQGRFNSNGFDFEGIVPIGYTAFAFALCLAAGTLLRRAIPAMGIGFVGFLGVRAVVEDRLRPNFLDPKTVTWVPTDPAPAAATFQSLGDGSWILSQGLIDAGGNSAGFIGANSESTLRDCMIQAGDKTGGAVNACLAEHGFLNELVYHPADRFWAFQAIETGIYLGLAAALLGLTAWWVTRRVA